MLLCVLLAAYRKPMQRCIATATTGLLQHAIWSTVPHVSYSPSYTSDVSHLNNDKQTFWCSSCVVKERSDRSDVAASLD